MKKIILTLFGFILSVMSVYAQVAAVSGLTVVPNNTANPTVITLTWTAYVQGTTPATKFIIERAPNNTAANFTVLTTLADVTLATYTDNVTPDSYCYRIKAVNSATPVVASAYSTPACVTLPQPLAPTTLAGVLTTPGVYTSISLSWVHTGTNATTTRFVIERSTISTTTGFSTIATVVVAVPSIPANFTYVDAALTPSNYYYRVRAANAFLYSGYSNVASVTIPALSAPTGLTVTPNGTISTSNALSWTANAPLATSQDIEVSSTLAGTYVLLTTVSGTATTYLHNTTGGNYCYRVRATVGSAVSAYSNAICTPVIPCASALLDQPTNVTATINIQVNTISLSWDDNASGETGYKVWRSTTPGFIPSASSTFTTAIQNVTGYADGTAAINSTYYYVVAAYCGASIGAYSDEIAVSTTIASASEFTVKVRPNEFVFDLEWLANVPNGTTAIMEDSTQIERTIDGPVPNWQFLKSVKNPGQVTPPPTGAPSGGVRLRYYATDDGSVVGMPFLPNTKYCYRVRAKKLYPSPSILGEVFSDYSTSACAITPAIEAPTQLVATTEPIDGDDYEPPTLLNIGTTPTILLSWKDNSIFETTYIIERKKDIVTTPAQVFVKLDSVTTKLGEKVAVRYRDKYLERTPKLKGLVPGAKYCYRVRAKTSGGALSAYSNDSCAVAYDISTNIDIKLSNKVKLYPNPATKNFFISLEATNVRANKAEIINLMGQKVAEQNLSSTTTEVSLQNLKSGLYYVRIQSDKGTIVKKLVVEN